MNPDNAEHCIACGDIIPEGRQICKVCEKKLKKGEMHETQSKT